MRVVCIGAATWIAFATIPVRSAFTFGAFRSLFAAHPAFRGQGAEEERAEIVMSRSSTHHHVAKPKGSLYEEITAHIVADLEAGIFPWAGHGGQVAAIRL